jgi:hypothetical protein
VVVGASLSTSLNWDSDNAVFVALPQLLLLLLLLLPPFVLKVLMSLPLLSLLLLLRQVCQLCCAQLRTLSNACLPAAAACNGCCRGLLWTCRVILPGLHSAPQTQYAKLSGWCCSDGPHDAARRAGGLACSGDVEVPHVAE